MPDRKMNITVKTTNISGDIIREQNCNAIMFTNIGDTIARVNGMVIFPSTNPNTILGDSRSFGGHKDEIYVGILRLVFNNPPGANPLVEIVQIFYTEANNK